MKNGNQLKKSSGETQNNLTLYECGALNILFSEQKKTLGCLHKHHPVCLEVVIPTIINCLGRSNNKIAQPNPNRAALYYTGSEGN